MKLLLKTERLLLRELNEKDTKFIVELLNTPGWLEFIGDRNVKNEDQALDYLNNGPLKSYADHGFGLYMVEIFESNTQIGICGLIKRTELDHVDIGFAFLPEYERKGFAYEAASSILNYAKNNLGLTVVLAITKENNFKSIRVLNKIGMNFIKYHENPKKEILMLFSNDDNN